MAADPVASLPTHVDGERIVVVETPAGSACKLTYDPELGVLKMGRVLPVGMTFPYSFGFLPRTRAEDGDPLDVLVLLDRPVPSLMVMAVRLIGVIEAEQRENDGNVVRNDRLLAIPVDEARAANLRTIRDVEATLLTEIETFFETYARLAGREFRPLRRRGSRAAEALARRHRDG